MYIGGLCSPNLMGGQYVDQSKTILCMHRILVYVSEQYQ